MNGSNYLRDPRRYGGFTVFVLKSVSLVLALIVVWIGVSAGMETGDLFSVVPGIVFGLTIGALYAVFVFAVAATAGWLVWRTLLALGLPLWIAVFVVSLLCTFALALALSRFVLGSGIVETGTGSAYLIYVVWLTGRIALLSVPIGLLVAWRTYVRLA